MRYLSDSEILSWNKKFQDQWRFFPKYTSNFSNPVIEIKQVINTMGTETFAECGDPSIKFDFIFSISKNRDSDFFRIFDQLVSEGFGTMFGYNGRYEKIDIDKKIILKTEKREHKIKEKEYCRYHYSLSGKMTGIMALITTLEDTIKFAEMMWGYSETGEEISLLNFPIGTVVSPKKDKSSDYIVLDYDFIRDWSGFRIDLKTYGMEFNEKSSVIQYTGMETFREDQLQFSRNSRIDQILN